MEQYGITNGTVFTLQDHPFQYVICDMVNWLATAKNGKTFIYASMEEMNDPIVVFRSVENINSKSPIFQQIGMPLSEYKKFATELPLSNRLDIYTEPLPE